MIDARPLDTIASAAERQQLSDVILELLLPVIPLRPAIPHDASTGKQPAIGYWTKESPAVLAEKTCKALKTGINNIGLRLDGLVVFDRDPRNDVDGDDAARVWEEIEQAAKDVNAPVTITGGGGKHIFFRLPRRLPGELPNEVSGCKGIEIKSGSKRQVVLPPSRHYSGQVYRAESGKTAAEHLRDISNAPELPKSLVRLVFGDGGGDDDAPKTKQRKKTGAAHAAQEEIPFVVDAALLDTPAAQEEGRRAFCEWAKREWPPHGVPVTGERNNATFRMACKAIEYGCQTTQEAVEEWLREFIGEYAAEDPRGAANTIASAIRHASDQRGVRNPIAGATAIAQARFPGFSRLSKEQRAHLECTEDGRLASSSEKSLLAIAEFDPLLRSLFAERRMHGSIYQRFVARDPFRVLLAQSDVERVAERPIDWAKHETHVSLAAWFEHEYGCKRVALHSLTALILRLCQANIRDAGHDACDDVLRDAMAWLGGDGQLTDEKKEKAEAYIDMTMKQLAAVLKAEHADWAAEALRMHLLASFRRLRLRPGEVYKHDHMIVFVGAQGAGKSTAIRHLALLPPETGGVLEVADLSRREYMDNANEHQFVVCDELAAFLRSREHDDVKRFVTDLTHTVNIKYGPVVSEGRRFVLWGATNNEEFLSDPTGNRRYWVIRTTATANDGIDFTALKAMRQQVWRAIALADLCRQATYPAEGSRALDFRRMAQEIENEHTASSFLESIVRAWVDERKARLDTLRAHGVSLLEVWEQLPEEHRRTLQGVSPRGIETRLGTQLRRLGWRRKRVWTRGLDYGIHRYFPP